MNIRMKLLKRSTRRRRRNKRKRMKTPRTSTSTRSSILTNDHIEIVHFLPYHFIGFIINIWLLKMINSQKCPNSYYCENVSITLLTFRNAFEINIYKKMS